MAVSWSPQSIAFAAVLVGCAVVVVVCAGLAAGTAFTPNVFLKNNGDRAPKIQPELGGFATANEAAHVASPKAAIPATLFMTGPFARHALPPGFRANIAAWKRHGPPDLQVHWFDDAEAEAWVANHTPQYLPEYQVLIPGAYKADLWRLLVLFQYGGVYADAGTSLLAPLWQLAGSANLVFCHDRKRAKGQGDIWQGVLGATAGHYVIGAMIDKVVSNIRARYLGSTCLSVTGPKAVSEPTKLALGPQRLAQLTTPRGKWIAGHYGDILILEHRGNELITAAQAKIVRTKNPGYNRIMYSRRKVPRYGDLWGKQKVYIPRIQPELAGIKP
jgi:hypothetical protein